MDLRAVGIVACLYMGLPVEAGNHLPIKKFESKDKDVNFEHFTKQQQDESTWNKPSNKADITHGSTTRQPVHIAQVDFKLGGFHNQHVVRLCTVDCRNTGYEITGYTIKSVGKYGGASIVFTDNNKQLTFSAQSLEKSKGLEFKVDVWGKSVGGISPTIPVALCVSPRS